MANAKITAAFDTSPWDAEFATMRGPMKESLARRMGVAGARVLSAEAKRWVPVKDGRLQKAIYHAYDKKEARPNHFTYKVSWNSSHIGGAPHGHLIEFGHWMPYRVVFRRGRFITLAKKTGGVMEWSIPHPAGGQGKWVPPKPFLRPAWEIGLSQARAAMLAAGRREVPILLSGGENGDVGE